MRLTILLCLLTSTTWLRAQPSTYADSSAIRLQIWSAGIIMESLRDGSSHGLRTFFKDEKYLSSIQPKLDSLASALKGKSHRPCLLGHASYGEEQRVYGQIFDASGRELAAVVFEFETADATARIFRLTIMKARTLSDEDIEEPPPTQQMLEEHQKR